MKCLLYFFFTLQWFKFLKIREKRRKFQLMSRERKIGWENPNSSCVFEKMWDFLRRRLNSKKAHLFKSFPSASKDFFTLNGLKISRKALQNPPKNAINRKCKKSLKEVEKGIVPVFFRGHHSDFRSTDFALTGLGIFFFFYNSAENGVIVIRRHSPNIGLSLSGRSGRPLFFRVELAVDV